MLAPLQFISPATCMFLIRHRGVTIRQRAGCAFRVDRTVHDGDVTTLLPMVVQCLSQTFDVTSIPGALHSAYAVQQAAVCFQISQMSSSVDRVQCDGSFIIGRPRVYFTSWERREVPRLWDPSRVPGALPPSNAEIKNAWSYTSVHPIWLLSLRFKRWALLAPLHTGTPPKDRLFKLIVVHLATGSPSFVQGRGKLPCNL